MKEKIKTGLKNYDESTGGFEKGKCYVISGMVGCGGTSFGLTMANQITKQHKVLFLSTIYGYSYIEEKQKNLSGNESHNLHEILPKYQTKEEFEEYIKTKIEKIKQEKKSEKDINAIKNEKRFELLKIKNSKEFLEVFKNFTSAGKIEKQEPEIVFYICHSLFNRAEDGEDKKFPLDLRFFFNFAKEHNIALVIITEINHVEIREPEYKELFEKTTNLTAIKLDKEQDITEGSLDILVGDEKRNIKIYLDRKKGFWKEK